MLLHKTRLQSKIEFFFGHLLGYKLQWLEQSESIFHGLLKELKRALKLLDLFIGAEKLGCQSVNH